MTTLTPTHRPTIARGARASSLLRACRLEDGARWGALGLIVGAAIILLLTLS